ncbi:hypothetical protein BMY_0206 [Wohlfahrtiimonas chitiniclastica]|nr:hypothetical protein BMY_0206 [Wohlfahrtiimonas chitiniclastica]
MSLFEENMPIYQYKCDNCGHEFEALQKISADPLTECPECKAPRLAKQVTAPNFRLKGSGWYETDFKSSNQKNLASQDSGSSAHQCGSSCSHKH